LHEASPAQAYQPREKVVAAAGLNWKGKPLDRIISFLAAEGLVEANGTTVKDPAFRVQLTPRQREFLDRAVTELRKQVINTPGVHELAKLLGAPPQAAEEILKLGGQAGEVVHIGEGVFYTPGQLDGLKAKVLEISGGKPFPASAIRDALGTTRKYAIPLLEYLDSIRFTTRVGDQRVVNKPSDQA
jgi:selenocysteine-specific elongation factor